MRTLTDAEIAGLASRPGVRRIAVENFLGTLDEGIGYRGNAANARADARAYGWDEATLQAILDGIVMARESLRAWTRGGELPEPPLVVDGDEIPF